MNPLSWHCSACNADGVLDMPSGYYSITLFFERLRTAHDRTSPDCPYDPSRMQIDWDSAPEANHAR
jgi:hypothetical protein